MKYFYHLLGVLFLFLSGCSNAPTDNSIKPIPQSGASLALEAWSLNRSYPTNKISVKSFTQAFEYQKSIAQSRNTQANWEAIGPMNIAGRTLALAFHPVDSNIIFLGSASGGLWKTTTAGLGEKAWQKISIGFPVLAVSSIAISPTNSDVIYIGTGEMYNAEETRPGVVNRLTRGTYGFGIFKSEDGGASWNKSLDWTYQEMRGVQDLIINPKNDQVLYAATSIGLIKSTDAGINWEVIHNLPMAVDVELNPIDTNILYVSYGSLFQENSGIYRSLNAGESFSKLRIGLPTTYSGKAMLSLDPSSDKTIYASVAEAFESNGLYRSSNNGESWVKVNSEDVAAFQGWYSHDVAVNPKNAKEIIQVGIDVWLSENNGFTISKQTAWTNARFGKNPVNGPDGPPNYVHSDIHQVHFHPLMDNTVFLATDGGVFVSKDGGRTYASRNGGLQTSQFYANFANATQNGDFAIGGMQDNSTTIYTGEAAWTKVLGGDGMSAAIDPDDNNIIYGSSQFLNIFRSTDSGQSFKDITPSAIEPIFSAPFEIAPSNTRVLYAGARFIFKSIDRGNTWFTPNPNFIDQGNAILNIAIAPNNLNHLLVSTTPNVTGKAGVFRSVNGGLSWTELTGLPDRIATDLVFHPENEDIAFITFGGFGSFHVYQTMNGGVNWFPIDNNLPDLPHNTITIDPAQPNNIYIGNDLSVYVSEDGGGTWSPFMDGLPEAILAMHLSISPANQKLRVATHGNGVFQTNLIGSITSSIPEKSIKPIITLTQNFPNPVVGETTIPFEIEIQSTLSLNIYDIKGRLVQAVMTNQQLKGAHQVQVNLNHLPSGNYVYQISGATKNGHWFKQSKLLQKK